MAFEVRAGRTKRFDDFGIYCDGDTSDCNRMLRGAVPAGRDAGAVPVAATGVPNSLWITCADRRGQ